MLGEALAGMLAERGIGFHPNQAIERIDPQARELVLAGGARAGYDLLLGNPAHRPPQAAATSGLADGTGFLPADPATLATSAEGVFAIGDVTAVPLAGVARSPPATSTPPAARRCTSAGPARTGIWPRPRSSSTGCTGGSDGEDHGAGR